MPPEITYDMWGSRFADGREVVSCDEEDGPCLAPAEPVTEAELRAALEHWRKHSFLGGCSHAR